MTISELRKRLKHIAGLCYGLSSDLALLLEENQRLLTDNAGLLGLLEARDKEIERLRIHIKSIKWYYRKKEEDPEAFRARCKINNKRAYEKRKAKKNESP